MTVHLGTLYHWTRRDHRAEILRNGLRVLEPCSDGTPAAFPWVCLATTPSAAWGLMPAILVDELTEDVFDLWQVRIREGDDLRIRGDFAPNVVEVRVLHGLPADRLWWAGERSLFAHDTLPVPATPEVSS